MRGPQNGDSAGDHKRLKLELKMKQMWRLMSRSVGTYFLIARWESLISLDACLVIVFVWDIGHADYDDWFVLIEDSEIAIFSVLHCHIRLGYWHADCIDCLSYFAQHSDSDICHDYSDRLACMDSLLVRFDMSILWLIYHLGRLWAWYSYHYSSWLSRLVCIHEWYILYSAWLHVAWLPFFYLIACRLSMWVSLLSPYLQLSWYRSFLSSRLSLLQAWDLLCACSLTEPEIRSRV